MTSSSSAAANHPATQYAQDVVDGKVLACKLVKQACQRHLSDLKTGKQRGLKFDVAKANHAIDFFEKYLRHWEGKWSGHPFLLEPWQKFIIGCIFGWQRLNPNWDEDDISPRWIRRFTSAYVAVPRKNGKSPMAAGIGLYLLVADGEQGAQVYTAATKRSQARIIHKSATNMVKRSRPLRKKINIYRDNLVVEETFSKFAPLGADSDTEDGLNVHGGMVDELHAHKNRGMWDVLDEATVARVQPLMFGITTAGIDQTSFCYEQQSYAEKVLSGTAKDDSFFAIIYTVDEEDKDNWDDPDVWEKANPNFGVSVRPEKLESRARKAREIPTALNSFLRKHLNIWTQQVDRWIPLDLWDASAGGPVIEEELAGRTCYGGLDLSSVSDLTAFLMLFPGEDDPERLTVLPRLWCPEARVTAKDNRYSDQYQAWKRDGFLRTTPGNVIDHGAIRQQIIADAQKFNLVDMNVDRYFNAHETMQILADEGITVVPFGLGYKSMSMPMKEFETRLGKGKIHHGGNPVLRWMADGVAVQEDPAGNLKPDKAGSQVKIDGFVALIMALDRAIRHEENKSVYERRGVVSF